MIHYNRPGWKTSDELLEYQILVQRYSWTSLQWRLWECSQVRAPDPIDLDVQQISRLQLLYTSQASHSWKRNCEKFTIVNCREVFCILGNICKGIQKKQSRKTHYLSIILPLNNLNSYLFKAVIQYACLFDYLIDPGHTTLFNYRILNFGIAFLNAIIKKKKNTFWKKLCFVWFIKKKFFNIYF